MGVNERVMTSSECTSYILEPRVSQISGVRENLLPFLILLFCLRWSRVWVEIISSEKWCWKNQVPLEVHPHSPEVCKSFVI